MGSILTAHSFYVYLHHDAKKKSNNFVQLLDLRRKFYVVMEPHHADSDSRTSERKAAQRNIMSDCRKWHYEHLLPSVTCQSLSALQRLCSALPGGCHSCQLAPPVPEQSEEWPQQASRRPGEDDKKLYLTAPVQTLSDQSYCCWDDLITSRLSLWSSCRTEIMLEEDGANNLLAATEQKARRS